MDYPTKFVIVKSSDRSGVSFLVDRQEFPNKWWTPKLGEAIRFNSEMVAHNVCGRLKYGSPRVQPVEDIVEELGYR